MYSMDKFLIYFVVINVATFLVYGADKRKAVKNKWRIPENTLVFLAFIGGSAGALAGMKIFRHKTQKAKFKFGIPVIIFLQIMLLIYLIYV